MASGLLRSSQACHITPIRSRRAFSHEKFLMPFIDRIGAAARGVAAAALGLVASAHAEEPNGQQPAATVAQTADVPTAAIPESNVSATDARTPRGTLDPRNPTGFHTTLSVADLDAREITGLDGLAAAEPEISYSPALNSLTTLSLYMRGEGPAAPGQITLDGAVGVYQDGFYISRLQSNTFDLLDPARTEVLAGPQGAMYGRDTAGGVINIVSQSPAGQLRFDQDVDFGNRNSYRILSSLDAPRWNGLSAKVTLLASSIDGYVKNQLASSHDYGSERQRAARLQLRWDALSGLRAEYFLERNGLDSTPAYDSNPLENGQTFFGIPYYANPTGPMRSTYRPVNLPLSTSNHTAQGLTLTWQPLSSLRIQSLTGYRTMDADEQQDYAEIYGYPSATEDSYNVRQLSQDLSFSGELFSRQLGYAVGATYFREKGEHDNTLVLLPQSIFDQTQSEEHQISATTRSRAVYARLSWRPAFLAGRLELAGASRYTRDSKDAIRSITENPAQVLDPSTPNHLSYNRLTPEGSLAWHFSEHLTTYARVSTAYVAGGALETAPIGSFGSTHFRPESSTTYEFGLQSSSLEGRLGADLAVFYSRRKDVQYALPVDRLTDNVFDFQRVTVKGATLALRIEPLRDLALSASATYLHWSIDRADAPAGTVFDPATGQGSPYVVGQNINGLFDLPYTPRYSALAAGDYTVARLDRQDILLHLDYVYRARMFTFADSGPDVPGNQFNTQQAYGLLDGRITLSQETDWAHRVKLSIWGRNILNRKYYQPALGVGAGLTSFDTTSGVATPSGYVTRAGAWAEPATYGLAIRYEY